MFDVVSPYLHQGLIICIFTMTVWAHVLPRGSQPDSEMEGKLTSFLQLAELGLNRSLETQRNEQHRDPLWLFGPYALCGNNLNGMLSTVKKIGRLYYRIVWRFFLKVTVNKSRDHCVHLHFRTRWLTGPFGFTFMLCPCSSSQCLPLFTTPVRLRQSSMNGLPGVVVCHLHPWSETVLRFHSFDL